MKLTDMSCEEFERYVDAGEYCDQDVIDLFNKLQDALNTLKRIENEIEETAAYRICDFVQQAIDRIQEGIHV
ncbi:hypothetical protein E0485_15085 [Paenibacillus albiflavus]|uniref:Uncharacterized protein n=1 Tax=Paenibacillus albiflavus TaxID=2545760 RepID=A0A4R4EB53_9BACL|nr:hypothetical protein [Paenibacillus albiflavus]TCZ76160.1 hypothetical protein E0485_15085 [Paenibacillus albiflavus]